MATPTAEELRDRGFALLEEAEKKIRNNAVSAGEMLHKVAETYLAEAENLKWREERSALDRLDEAKAEIRKLKAPAKEDK